MYNRLLPFLFPVHSSLKQRPNLDPLVRLYGRLTLPSRCCLPSPRLFGQEELKKEAVLMVEAAGRSLEAGAPLGATGGDPHQWLRRVEKEVEEAKRKERTKRSERDTSPSGGRPGEGLLGTLVADLLKDLEGVR